MKHKHHELFEAAARGEVEQFGAKHSTWSLAVYADAADHLIDIYRFPDRWTVRRRQRTHVINGWEVPAPMTKAPKDGGAYWTEDSGSDRWAFKRTPSDTYAEQLYLKRGNCHATKQGAIQNCKARHGVDPFAEGEGS